MRCLEEGQALSGVKMNNLQGDYGSQAGQEALSLLPDFCDVGRGRGGFGHGYEGSSPCSVVSLGGDDLGLRG